MKQQKQLRIYHQSGGLPCTNSLESHIKELGTMILRQSDARRSPWPKKLLKMGLAPVSEIYGSEVMLHYPGLYAGSTDLVCTATMV